MSVFLRFNLFIVVLFFFVDLSFAEIDIKQGELIDYSKFSKISIGMNKLDVVKILGTPILFSNNSVDYLCYYFYLFPRSIYSPIKRQYLVLFFSNSLLTSYIFRRL